jgi:hypothetical protein
MTTKLFLMPFFLHVLLVLTVGVQTFRARTRAVRNGSAKMSEIAADPGAWPRKVRLLGNNFDNQFDTPMLWYSAAGLIVALNFTDMIFVGMSWMFLLTRMAHTLVHTGGNDVPSRARIFALGFFVLVLMWTWLAIKLFLLG